MVASPDRKTNGDIDLFSAAGAVKLTSHLALGVSADFWRGAWTDRTTLIEESARDDSPAFFATTTNVHLRGQSRSAGLLLTYPGWDVGLVYHAPFWSAFNFQGRVLGTGSEPGSIDAVRASASR